MTTNTEQLKHTPGPWRVDDIGTNCLFIKGGVHVESGASASEREYYSNLATITQRDPHPHLDGGIHRKVTMANARLIAAAPDHHAVALELDRLMLVIESAVRRQDPSHSEAVVAMLKANRAAIAKATGEHHD